MSGDLDCPVLPVRWHPNVGEYDVWTMVVNCPECLAEVTAGGDDLDLVAGLEHPSDTLANQEIVFGQHYSDRPRSPALPTREAPVSVNARGIVAAMEDCGGAGD